jgi:hypothetical protein
VNGGHAAMALRGGKVIHGYFCSTGTVKDRAPLATGSE